jgi:hypothetical protein
MASRAAYEHLGLLGFYQEPQADASDADAESEQLRLEL